MRVKSIHIILAVMAIAFLLNTSCRKDKVQSVGGSITFSVDTLAFDTVFTAAGSFTASLKIYNPQSEAVVLSSVRMQNGSSSYFHLNVDGVEGNNVTNIKIEPHDSAYVFAIVNIDPTNVNSPFLITDQLIATLNGNDFSIPFTAYGQNAHYVIDSTLDGNITWLTDKPYVIIHNAEVDSGATLNIPPGCRVYVNQDSRLLVAGTLMVGSSTAADSVVFQGDRLDRAYFGYEGYPGEWGGLYFAEGSTGNIQHTIFKNCGGSTVLNGITISPAAIQLSPGASLTMDHTIIENSIGYGILNFQGSLTATNCLVNTCGAQALAILQGGYDSIINCTFAIYSTDKISHTETSTVAILNYYTPDGINYTLGDLNAVMRNCIIWGSLDNEVTCDAITGAQSNLVFDHCLYKSDSALETFVVTKNCIANQDPLFKNYSNFDFRLSSGSPAIGNGVVIPILNNDLDYNLRTSTNDIGCYQYQN